MGKLRNSYKVESVEFEIAVDRAAAELVKEGVAPWPAMMRALEIVKKKRAEIYADQIGS